MAEDDTQKLGKFLREVSNWRWDEFWVAERDGSYSSNDAMIFALIRACAMQRMDAIRMSLNRLDGKLKTPVRIEYPKVYIMYPYAAMPDVAPVGELKLVKVTENPETVNEVVSGEVLAPVEPQIEDDDLSALSMRETLTKMSNFPRNVPEFVVSTAQATEEALRNKLPLPDNVPRVKSVVAAHLLIMAQSRKVDALTEVFDQIDGKLAETLQLIGEDIYITSYAKVAPPDAYINKNGVLESVARAAQDIWAQKLGKDMLT